MCSYPIETVRGRHGGGVKIADGFYLYRKKLTARQAALLVKSGRREALPDAVQLAAGEIKSADEFPQAEPPKPSKPPEPAHEPERAAELVTEPPASPAVPYTLGDKHYDTLEMETSFS